MPTLSLAMIVKDEAQTLGRILQDASAICDEMVVVDTGSSDNTVEIAKQFGAKVYHFQWCDDFSAARNYSFERCTGDWIIWLDADDRIQPSELEKIRRLKETDLTREDIDGVFMTYNYQFDENGNCLWSLERERIIRNNGKYKWVGLVYEYVDILKDNALLRFDIIIEHHPTTHQITRKEGRNIDLFYKSIEQGDRTFRTFLYLGDELELEKRYEEAVNIYQQFVALEGAEPWQYYHAMVRLGMCQLYLYRDKEGLATLIQAILLDSGRAEAYMILGHYFYQRQLWTKAIPFFRMPTFLDFPETGFKSSKDYRLEPYEMLSKCYLNLGDRDKAIKMLEAGLSFAANEGEKLYFSSALSQIKSTLSAP